MKSSIFLVASIGFILWACTSDVKEEMPLGDKIIAVKNDYAPDKRTALFNIEATKNSNDYILRGESNLPDAVDALKADLTKEDINFIDSIQLLPHPNLKGKTNAVINISVANLRSNPKHSAELSTQATLGMPLKVLKTERDWYYIQTPDNYLSWVDGGGIELMEIERFERWRGADKMIYTHIYGHAYLGEDEELMVSDLVAGNVLEVLKYGAKHFKVQFPDGRQAFVRKDEAEIYSNWLENLNPTPDDLVDTSKKLMGVPYLWGGTSTKGMDCSGFTKTIYFLNGMVIPRDASQQVHTGKLVDSVQDFSKLRKGDLLFFGRKATDSTKEKVVHVGLWIGNNEFIHASNRIRVGSMDSKAKNFDEYNLNRYLRTKRVFEQKGKGLIDLAQTPIFKD